MNVNCGKVKVGLYITLHYKCLYRSLPTTEMEVSGGPVVKKKLLNIIEEKADLKKHILQY